MPNLVNHTDKWGFIHIPKTGGSSIDSQLNNLPNVVIIDTGHSSLRYFRKIDNYFIFCFARNPFHRLISGYLNFNRKLIIPTNPYQPADPDTNTFIYDFNYIIKEKNIREITLSEFIKLIDNHRTFMPDTQSWQIYDGETPEKKVSFIGRYENYDKDVRFIFDKININYTSVHHNFHQITSKHVTREEFYKQQYTEQWMIDWVLDRYKEDFENFGYDKKL
jgi:hypothetical protein